MFRNQVMLILLNCAAIASFVVSYFDNSLGLLVGLRLYVLVSRFSYV